jgi:hypothetical protein
VQISHFERRVSSFKSVISDFNFVFNFEFFFRFLISVFEFRFSNFGFRISAFEFRLSNFSFRISLTNQIYAALQANVTTNITISLTNAANKEIIVPYTLTVTLLNGSIVEDGYVTFPALATSEVHILLFTDWVALC